MLVGVLLLAGEGPFRGRPLGDCFTLVVSGVIGIALSDTLFHRCLNLVGAGINAVVDCLFSPCVAVLAFMLLDERLGPLQLGGMVLVISGVLMTTRALPPEGATRRDLLAGIGWGAGAMLTLAYGVVLAKPVLAHHSVIWATTFRQVASFAVMAVVAVALPQRREIWAVFRPRADWKFSLPGTVLGSFLALMLWLAGMKYTEAGTAAIINQTSTVFILILAALFLREPFTARRWVAAGLALVGIVMVTFG